MVSAHTGRLALVLAGSMFLTACEDGQKINLFGAGNSADGGENNLTVGNGIPIEQDIESPEVFEQTDSGLWDGRPSLGGVWIAHPNVVDPERVMIRNEDNGKSIIGALFRRERENPGPKFQVSSDAADELGMLAGAPNNLSVVALRRVEAPVVDAGPTFEEAPDFFEVTEAGTPVAETVATIGTAETIAAASIESIDPVAALAASAIEAATAQNPTAQLPGPSSAAEAAQEADGPVTTTLQPETLSVNLPVQTPAAPVAPAAPVLTKPFVQIGIFSVESNANDTSKLLRSSGIIPTIKVSQSSGKTYWRVVVGPMQNPDDRATVISKVKGLGFPDAYAVTN
ncbi:MAG: SPOR domain-containing protein [Paracoccaceae bacterium]